MPAGAATLGIMAAGTAASGIGSILGAKSANPKTTPVPPPTPVFPWLNQQYTGQIGTAGTQGIQSLQQTSKTGNPVDVSGAFESLVNANTRMKDQGRANILESLGSSGLRYGTTARDAITDYESQTTKDYTATLSDMIRQMTESAASRSTNASTILASMFGTSAMTLTPQATLTTGSQSPTGTGLKAAGSGIETIGLLRSLGII